MIGTLAPRAARGALLLALLGTLAAASSREHPEHVSAASLLAHGSAAAGPILAVALHGDIYTLRADGSTRARLTTGGQASSPQLSPDGRTVAYFVADRTQPAQGTPSGAVYVLSLDRTITAKARPLDATHTAHFGGRLFWSPDSAHLAYYRGTYYRGTALVLDSVRGRGMEMVLPPHGTTYAGDLAWSPDGIHMAAPLARRGMQEAPQTLLVAVGTPGSARWQQIRVRFPAGALGLRNGNIPVSAPGNDPVWAPDGRGLLLSTQLVGEGFVNITGIWRVGSGGGLAHLAIGTASGVRHGTPAVGDQFAQATRFLPSPDRTLLATDPPRGMWVASADGSHGRFLPVTVPRLCVLAQFAWLRDNSGLAYVQTCPSGGGAITARMTLFSVRLDGSRPRQLYAATSGDQQAVDLGPAYRCVACGG